MPDFQENPNQNNGGGFLDKLLNGVQQANKALEMYYQTRNGTVSQTGEAMKQLGGGGIDLDKIMRIFQELGLADKSIADIFKAIENYTPNQLRALGEKYGGNNSQSQE